MVLYYLLERSIPPRLRLAETEITLLLMRYESWSKRRLLKELYQAWTALGRKVRRGMVLPDLGTVTKWLSFQIDLIKGFNSAAFPTSGRSAWRL